MPLNLCLVCVNPKCHAISLKLESPLSSCNHVTYFSSCNIVQGSFDISHCNQKQPNNQTTKPNNQKISPHTHVLLSLLPAQIVGAGVQKLNPQTIRTSSVGGGVGVAQQSAGQAQSGGSHPSTAAIQLVGAIPPRTRNVQVVGTKQLAPNRQLITAQRQIGGSTLKIATTPVNGE